MADGKAFRGISYLHADAKSWNIMLRERWSRRFRYLARRLRVPGYSLHGFCLSPLWKTSVLSWQRLDEFLEIGALMVRRATLIAARASDMLVLPWMFRRVANLSYLRAAAVGGKA